MLRRPRKNLPKHTGNDLHLGDTVAIPQHNTNLRRRSTLLGELADLVDDLVGGDLEPGRGGTRVRDRRAGDTLSVTVHATHVCGFVESFVVCLGARVGLLSMGGLRSLVVVWGLAEMEVCGEVCALFSSGGRGSRICASREGGNCGWGLGHEFFCLFYAIFREFLQHSHTAQSYVSQ